MQVEYTVADYFAPFLVCTIGSVLIVGTLCVMIGRKAAIKFQRFWLTYIPIIGLALYLLLLGSYAVPILNQTGDLLIPSEYEIKAAAGQIDEITPAENTPIYYVGGKICGADYLSINHEQYYVISEDLLAEGMLVEVRYAAFENNVILSWQEVSADRVVQVQNEAFHEQPSTDIPAPRKPTPKMQTMGSIFTTVGFVGVVCIALLLSVIDQRIKSYLFRQDLLVYGKIIPNRKFLCLFLLPFICIVMIVTGMWMMNGDTGALLILLIAGILVLIIIGTPVTLELDGDFLYLRRLGKEQAYRIADIYSVSFKSSRGIIGRSLVIVFKNNKSYWFDMDRYCGVQNVYNELMRRMQ